MEKRRLGIDPAEYVRLAGRFFCKKFQGAYAKTLLDGIS